jgi:hypothetical protein
MQGALEDARSAIPKGPLPDFLVDVAILSDEGTGTASID